MRIDVDTGEMLQVTDGIGIPAAMKFNSLGQLHVLDHLSGEVLRVDTETGNKEVIAQLPPGLDEIKKNVYPPLREFSCPTEKIVIDNSLLGV